MDWTSIGESAITGGISGLLGLAGSAIQAKQQYKYQSRLMNNQNAFNLDMWNKSNAYNDPSAVAERYSNAGFNPAMMMTGQGASEANPMQSASPSFIMPDNNLAGNFTAGIQNYIGLKNMVADLRKKEAEARKTEQESAYQDIINKWADTSEEERINYLREQINTLKVNQKLSETEVQKLEAEIPFISRLSEAQIQNLRSSSQKLMQEVATEIQKRKNMKVEVAQMFANIAYLNALKDKTQEEADKAHYEQQILEIEAYIQRVWGQGKAKAELKRMESESYGLFMDNMSKYIDNLNKINGIDTKSNPVNNALRMLQIILHPSSGPGSANPGVPIPSPYDPTSSISPKLDNAIEKMLAMSLSGSRSHKSHRNLDFHNPMMG